MPPFIYRKMAINPHKIDYFKIKSKWHSKSYYLHVKSGDDSLNGIACNWSNNICRKIGCGGYLVFQKLLKINTSQAYATLYLYKKFGDDIFITFPLIDRTSSKMLSQQNLQVPSMWPFCFNLIASKKNKKLAKYYDYSPARQIWRR